MVLKKNYRNKHGAGSTHRSSLACRDYGACQTHRPRSREILPSMGCATAACFRPHVSPLFNSQRTTSLIYMYTYDTVFPSLRGSWFWRNEKSRKGEEVSELRFGSNITKILHSLNYFFFLNPQKNLYIMWIKKCFDYSIEWYVYQKFWLRETLSLAVSFGSSLSL